MEWRTSIPVRDQIDGEPVAIAPNFDIASSQATDRDVVSGPKCLLNGGCLYT